MCSSVCDVGHRLRRATLKHVILFPISGGEPFCGPAPGPPPGTHGPLLVGSVGNRHPMAERKHFGRTTEQSSVLLSRSYCITKRTGARSSVKTKRSSDVQEGGVANCWGAAARKAQQGPHPGAGICVLARHRRAHSDVTVGLWARPSSSWHPAFRQSPRLWDPLCHWRVPFYHLKDTKSSNII